MLFSRFFNKRKSLAFHFTRRSGSLNLSIMTISRWNYDRLRESSRINQNIKSIGDFLISTESSLLQQTIFWERIRRTFLYRSLRATYLYVSEFRLTLKHGSIQVQSKSQAYLDKIYAFDTSWPPEWMSSTVLHFLWKRMEWLNIDKNVKKNHWTPVRHPCKL